MLPDEEGKGKERKGPTNQPYTNQHSHKPPSQGPEQPVATSPEERAMLRAVQVRQAVLGVQNGVLRVIFVALAILKVRVEVSV